MYLWLKKQHPNMKRALIAQLGERQTEDLKVTGSIPVQGISFLPNYPFFVFFMVIFCFFLQMLHAAWLVL
jgi:hypothetical protein